MADVADRTTIQAWESHWAEPGSLFVLVYRPPPRSVCADDGKVFSRVESVRGLTRAPRGYSDTPWRGYERVPCYICQPPELLECWVVVTEPSTLGRKLQTRILPCEGVAAAYELARVDRVRADNSAMLRAVTKIGDALDSGPGAAVGGAAAAGVSAVTSQLVNALLPLAVPLVVAFLIYRAVGK